MSGLSKELHIQLRNTLLQCREFESDVSLRAVFVVDELLAFKPKLPEAENLSDRVDRCIAYLLDKKNSNGQPVLPLFLSTLRDRYDPYNVLRTQLDVLGEADWSVPNNISLLSDVVPLSLEFTTPPRIKGFVGRVEEKKALASKLAESHVIIITGMPGVGKSALAAELAVRSAGLNKAFWHSFRFGGGIPFAARMLASFLFWHGHSEPWRRFQNARPHEDQHAVVRESLDEAFRAIQGQSYLLCFDDLHYAEADPLFSDFLERLRQTIRAGESSFIVTCRGVPSTLVEFEDNSLSGLSRADANSLFANRGIQLAESARDRLYARIEGNAQLLISVAGILKRSASPEGLIDRLVRTKQIRRFFSEIDESLSEGEREVMNAVALSLKAYPGTRDVLEAILDKGNVQRTLDCLVDDALLSEEEHYAQVVYVQHSMLQEFYYEWRLGERDRKPMHQRAGEYYEATDTLTAAIHYELAEQSEQAAWLATADIWSHVSRGRTRELAALLAKFQAQQLEPVLWARVCHSKGTLLEFESPVEALQCLDQGLKALGGVSQLEEGLIHLRKGSVLLNTGELSDAEQELRKSLELLPEEESDGRGAAMGTLGIVYGSKGDMAAAQRCFEDAFHIYDASGNKRGMLGARFNLIMVAEIQGDWNSAVAGYKEATDLAEQLGDAARQQQAELNLGILHMNRGDADLAEAQLRRCIELAHTHGLRVQLINGLSSLADLAIRSNDLTAAEALVSEAQQLALKTGTESLLPEIYRRWAELHLAKDELQEAMDLIEQSVNSACEMENPPEESMSRRVMGQVLSALGQHDRAGEEFERSISFLDEYESYEAARTRMEWGRAFLSAGDVESGVAKLREALATFQELGARRETDIVEALLP